ncbi:hypothetical protein F8B43_1914 [Methylorubrum populi]|uniref:Uncharacterized protein n=1 Tax=Methylorubrum populi TaxID=223967 RepID=A0A833N0U9_9HYPH|nr:hypothetical protein F8B43_1914 [Methylorubrum populi]
MAGKGRFKGRLKDLPGTTIPSERRKWGFLQPLRAERSLIHDRER